MMFEKLEKNVGGFTLIELLIVMSIIGMLVTLGVVSFRTAQIRARDVQRKSDLRQYQTSLEIYANRNNGLYPSRTGRVRASTTLCNDLGITNCPEDTRPASAGIFYRYTSDGTGGGSPNASIYLLYAKLEDSPNDYWVNCSNGVSGTMPSSTTFSNPTCPL